MSRAGAASTHGWAPSGLSATRVERSSQLVSIALSDGRRDKAQLISGDERSFGLSAGLRVVHVPFPALEPHWTLRTITCGIAMQCSPSKERISRYSLHELAPREAAALLLVEGRVALGWIAERWPGLLPHCVHALPGLYPDNPRVEGVRMLDRAMALARSSDTLPSHPLLGRLPVHPRARTSLATKLRIRGRMPWSSKRQSAYRIYSVPVGGEGGVRNPNLPPPSRPEDEEIEARPDRRAGIPYPEWNFWTETYRENHVAVLERKQDTSQASPIRVSPEIRRWFEQRTHRIVKRRLEDGTELDTDRYVDHHVDVVTGHTSDGRVYGDLVPGSRDVTTAILLDGSSSLGVHNGAAFRLELECADALSQALTLARERHGIFVFTGNTRHRVEVRCLKDFEDRQRVLPSQIGLGTAGYTRLGAPLRHLTRRLLDQPSERRVLIVLGDGLMSDEGYEGRYAWHDVIKAIEEADDAGVVIYYVGVGEIRVDPLPEVFGERRSQRIRRVEDLPRVLARVHQELIEE